MYMNPRDAKLPDDAYETYGRTVKKCEYCGSYNVSLDSSTGKISCNNPECSHKEKQKGKQEDFDQKISDIHEKESNNLRSAIMKGQQVNLGDSQIPGINKEPRP